MTDITLSTFYTVVGRSLQVVEDGFTLPISTYIGKRAYAIVSVKNQTSIAVDVNKIIAGSPNPARTATYATIIQAYFNEHDGEDVTIDYFPQVSRDTQKFPYRIDSFDPQAEAGWVVSFGDVGNLQLVGDLNQIGTLDDLIITAPEGTNLNNLLVAVCGIFHSTKVMGNALYVIDGFATIKQMGVESIVVCDTTSLGGHTIIPITADMVVGDSTSYTSAMAIKASGCDFTKTTPLLSVDGYLQILNDIYQIRDAQTLVVKTNRIDIPENFVYSPSMRYVRDVLSINNIENPYNPSIRAAVNQGTHPADRKDTLLYSFLSSTTIPKAEFDNLNFYIDRLTSPHSFIVVINNPHIFTMDFPLINKGEDNLYEIFTNDMPRGTLFYGRGYCYPYTRTYNKFDPQHLVFINKVVKYADLYKTGKDNPTYVSARFDYIDETLRVPAFIREVFSGYSAT